MPHLPAPRLVHAALCAILLLTSAVTSTPIVARNDHCANAESFRFFLQLVSGYDTINGTYGKLVGDQIQFGHNASHANRFALAGQQLSYNQTNYPHPFNLTAINPKPKGENRATVRPLFFGNNDDAYFETAVNCTVANDCNFRCAVQIYSFDYSVLYVYHAPDQYTLQIGGRMYDAAQWSPVRVDVVPAR